MTRREITRTSSRIGVAGLVTCLLLAASTAAGAQSRRKPVAESQPPRVSAKIYKRPLLRSGRIQYCLKQLGRFDGRINGRMTPATVRALVRFRDDFELRGDDVAQEWPLHVALWRQCRDGWVRNGGSLDRFGFAVWRSGAVKGGEAAVPRSAAPLASPPVEAAASAGPTPTPLPTNAGGVCLSGELRDILQRSTGARPETAACEQPCLPLPPDLDRDDARAYERRLNFHWCKACVAVQGELRLDDILRIEKAGNITLCPDPRRMLRPRPPVSASVTVDSLRGVRALFRRDLRAAEPHNGLAVVIGLSQYANGGTARPRADHDAAGMAALLVERLGFRGNRVIELRNPTSAELEGVFGRGGNAKGLLADRLKDSPDVPLLIYVSGLGTLGADDGEANLLGADAAGNRGKPTGLALEALYQTVARSGVGSATVILEVDFSGDPAAPVVSPNAPAGTSAVLPRSSQRNLAVLAASDRDQRPLEDQETGLSLFTRHLIEALSGHADVAPVGNGDGTVDSAEAFVYAASRTSFVARKVSGVLQRPTISQSRVQPIARLGAAIR